MQDTWRSAPAVALSLPKLAVKDELWNVAVYSPGHSGRVSSRELPEHTQRQRLSVGLCPNRVGGSTQKHMVTDSKWILSGVFVLRQEVIVTGLISRVLLTSLPGQAISFHRAHRFTHPLHRLLMQRLRTNANPRIQHMSLLHVALQTRAEIAS